MFILAWGGPFFLWLSPNFQETFYLPIEKMGFQGFPWKSLLFPIFGFLCFPHTNFRPISRRYRSREQFFPFFWFLSCYFRMACSRAPKIRMCIEEYHKKTLQQPLSITLSRFWEFRFPAKRSLVPFGLFRLCVKCVFFRNFSAVYAWNGFILVSYVTNSAKLWWLIGF